MKKRTRSKKAESLYCWRKFQHWSKRRSDAYAKACYWMRRHNQVSLP